MRRRLVGLALFTVAAFAQPPSRMTLEEAGQAIELETHYRDPEQPPSSSGSPVPVLFTTAQGLPPGPHTFVVQAEDFAPAVCRVEVVADKLVRTKVELQPR